MNDWVIILQARMGSSRLPGKVLKPILNAPMLEYLLRRLNQLPLKTIVATTSEPQDDPIARLSDRLKVEKFRGSHHNVLERYSLAFSLTSAKNVVRLTADNPLVDGFRIIKTIQAIESSWTSRSYLRSHSVVGLGFEMFSGTLLLESQRSIADNDCLEHVTPQLRDGRMGNVLIHDDPFPTIKTNNDLSLTVDTPEDFEFMSFLIERYELHKCSEERILGIIKNSQQILSEYERWSL